MNYIKKLEMENKELKAEIERMREGMQEIRIYIASPKFTSAPLEDYVNTGDIEMRLSEVLNNSFY